MVMQDVTKQNFIESHIYGTDLKYEKNQYRQRLLE